MTRILPGLDGLVDGLVARGSSAATALRVIASSRVVRPHSPVTLARLTKVLRDWGTGPAGGFATLAVRAPEAIGLCDELGTLTWRELHGRSNSLARALAELGVHEGDGVAVMCRNHRGFLDATLAANKLGADVLYLNTAFAGPQLTEVLQRERPKVLVHDQEFEGLLSGALEGSGAPLPVVAWTDSAVTAPTLDGLIARHSGGELRPPSRRGRLVILTSGTTGTPKGAPRNEAGVDAAISLLSRMPVRAGYRTHVAAPLFHTWGLAHLLLAMLLGTPLVLRRRFDPEQALRAIASEKAETFAVIPVMLQRILALPEELRSAYDVSCLQVVASSGSALPGDLALAWMDAFGDNLYNVYGSTEVAYASIATPEDLRAAPSSAGRPPWGTAVRILDRRGAEVPAGESGRIFVGNTLLFEGYTGGGHKEVVDGLMSTGDVGRFGPDGRLYVEGRDDEMIVSGGENVFPKEVEDCLVRHPAVADAAAVGVEDPDYGQRLRAFVVVAESARGVTDDDLKEWVRDNLARYKVPREIVQVPELPRNATGKVLKRELAGWQRADDRNDEKES
ncbi:AMP-binding protein [Nocardioides sp. CER19]|uniref:AMP-binding protein n=1 Tax=Nocardioides sp. CER19 TaxID=3038538 RepID=UPI0024483EEB|nr:AMP-binding protein [Nocardioides sp. CER19]MDH2416324.1 AMP-binding protein [Nocardioides sp. CER19]